MWIDINNKVPENDEDVLVTDGDGSYCVAYWDGGEWNVAGSMLDIRCQYGYECEFTLGYRVTHWKEFQ